MEPKIPKIIHYCWFGGNPKPQLVLRCIESWKKYCPDFEIIEWNEGNYDIHSNLFVEEAYLAKKWAFVSDYIRGEILLQRGGIYLDTDMELLQPLLPLLEHSFFAGFEARDTIASCIIGCCKENEIMRLYFDYYKGKHFCRKNFEGITTSPIVLTKVLKDRGVKMNGKKQFAFDYVVYPKRVFIPSGIGWVVGYYSRETIGIHHFMDSWGKNPGLAERSWLSKLRLCLLNYARDLLGTSKVYEIGLRRQKNRQAIQCQSKE